MPRNPRFWLAVAGGWLLLGAIGHTAYHVGGIVLANDFDGGLREFAMNAMVQAQSPDPLRPSLWRVFRLYSASLALLWLFAGTIDLVFAARRTHADALATVALVQTVFWTLAFVPFALIDPVLQPLAIVMVAVPLHGIAYLTAAAPEPSTE